MLLVIIVATSVYIVQLAPVIRIYVMATQQMLYNSGKFSIVMVILVAHLVMIFPEIHMKK